MPLSLALIGSAIIGGGMSMASAGEQNQQAYANQLEAQQFNAEQAQKQMDFQASQTATAYQRAVTDLKAAGLNPMLAYSRGGAASGSGASATSGAAPVVNPMGNAPEELASLPMKLANVQLASAQAAREETTATLQSANARLTDAQAVSQEFENNENLGLKNEMLKNQVKASYELPRFSTAQRAKEENQAFESQASAETAWARHMLGVDRQRQELKKGELDLRTGELGLKGMGLTQALQALNIPGASAEAEKSKTWWGGHVTPYLEDLGRLLHSGVQARRLGTP